MSKYALVKVAEEYALSTESAMAQLMDLLSYYDIDMARVTDDEAAKQIERILDTLVDYIRRGKVEIRWGKDEKIEVIHNTERGAQIVYVEVNAAAKQAMDRHPGDARYTRIYAFMGSLSGMGSEAITKLGSKDLAVVEVLGTVFMAA